MTKHQISFYKGMVFAINNINVLKPNQIFFYVA